jgi:membrane protease YdiL (CAAX protease family)
MLVPIVLSEELVWRGVLARLLIERRGWAGLFAAALLYAAAHATAAGPLLLLVLFVRPL